MSARLECTAARQPPLVVLRVVGTLDQSTGPELRSAMLSCLAEQPTAVMIDATSLTVGDDTALIIFRAAACHAAAWPSIPILLCAPAPEVASAMTRLGIDRHVTICDSLAEGRALAGAHQLPTRIHDRLPPDAGSVPVARGLVTEACTRWHLPHVAYPAGLVVTELVTNAVVHAGTGIELFIARAARRLHLAIRDYAQAYPRLVRPEETAPGGRGLIVVAALAANWGWTPTPDGKVTWASLRTAVVP